MNIGFKGYQVKGECLLCWMMLKTRANLISFCPTQSFLYQGVVSLLTSQDQHLLKVVFGECKFYLHEVTPLKCGDSQKLFNLHAFGNEEAPQKFKRVASDVSKACGGLPLALKVVGSSLFDKRDDEDLENIRTEAVDALKGDCDVTSALKWSYDCLLESTKLMFVDIACVSHGLMKEEVLEVWKSCKKYSSCCGCERPYTSLRQLIDRSLVVFKFHLGEERLAMHDLLQDMGRSIELRDGSHLW